MPESTTIFSVEAVGQAYNQTNEFVLLGGNDNQNTDLPIEVDRRIRNAWCSFRKHTFELYDRPSAPLELKIRMLRAEVLKTMLCCVTRSPRACHYDTLRRAHHRFLTRCIAWRKHNRADHPISYLDMLIKTGSESIEVILRRRRILFARFVARMKDTRLPKCVIFADLVGGAAVWGTRKKSGCGVSWTTSGPSVSTPTSRRLQPRARRNGAERRGIFHGEMDRCRERQRWTMTCSRMPEHDEKDQGEDSPKQTGSCWFARPY